MDQNQLDALRADYETHCRTEELLHQGLTLRLNELAQGDGASLFEGDVRFDRDGKITFYEWENYNEKVHFIGVPQWNGDAGASFSVRKEHLFNDEKAKAKLAELDAEAEAERRQLLLESAFRKAKQEEAERELYEQLREKFEPKG